jgi:hypothetical protein
MTLKHSAVVSLAAAMVVAIGLIPSLASAQAVGSTSNNYVSVTSTPSTTNYAPGSNDAVLGTIMLTATEPGSYEVSSIPFTLTTTGSGTASDLSGCQLVDDNGTALNTNGNELNSVSAGNNTLVLDMPLTVTNGSPVTLTVRCNTSSSTPANSTFAFMAGTPNYAAELSATLTTFPSVTPGEMNAPIAALTLNSGASGSNLNITSVPLTVTYGNGLSSNDLSDCHTTYSGSTLDSNSTGVINSGADMITFNVPLSATAGGAAMPLLLSCNVSSAAPVGSTIALSLAPSGIMAADATDGSSVAATQGYDPVTGASGSLGGTTTVVSPTMTTTTTTTTGTVTAPNTGAGANAPLNIALLLASALLALMGGAYLARTLRTQEN